MYASLHEVDALHPPSDRSARSTVAAERYAQLEAAAAYRRECRAEVRGSKRAWALAISLNVAGTISDVIWGRRRPGPWRPVSDRGDGVPPYVTRGRRLRS